MHLYIHMYMLYMYVYVYTLVSVRCLVSGVRYLGVTMYVI